MTASAVAYNPLTNEALQGKPSVVAGETCAVQILEATKCNCLEIIPIDLAVLIPWKFIRHFLQQNY